MVTVAIAVVVVVTAVVSGSALDVHIVARRPTTTQREVTTSAKVFSVTSSCRPSVHYFHVSYSGVYSDQ
jgi:hypothetical protein